MASQFSTEQLTKLRDEYATIDKIDPSSLTYKALVSKLDKMSPDTLRQLADARIKFISSLATNRVRNAVKKPVSEGNPKTKQWFDAVGAKQKTVADLPTSMDNKRLGRGVVKMTTQKYQDKLMKESSPTQVHAELIQQIAQEVQSMPRVANEAEYKAAIRRSLQTKSVIPVSQIESMVQWFIKAHPFSAYHNRSTRSTTESVTDYSGKLGGNRKSLLARLSAATTKQQQSELATQARRAGATQSEIKNVTKALTELSDEVLTSYEKRAQHQKRVATDVANRDDVDPRTWIRATNFAGKRDQGIHRAKSKLAVTEYADDTEHFDSWYDWNQAVRSSGGTTEHVGAGKYRAVGIDDAGFGSWDENTGSGTINFNTDSSLDEATDDVVEPGEDRSPRDVEREQPAQLDLEWISKFDLGEIKEAMQKIVDHLADTEDAEKTDLLRNDIRVLDNLHNALRKADGELVKKCWAIAKSEGSDEHLHDEFIRRMDDALTQSGMTESLHESTFTNKAKWKQAAKQYRVKETDAALSAFCKDSGEMVGRWSNAKSKGWVDEKSSD